jgi:hypothetical protein
MLAGAEAPAPNIAIDRRIALDHGDPARDHLPGMGVRRSSRD